MTDDKPEILKRKTLAEITNAERDSIRTTELREFEAVEKACCSEGVTVGDDALPKQGMTGSCAVDYQHNTTGAPPILEPKVKRGKDIKVFADLPPHVQETIDIMSDDKTEHKRRTAIAINYQHQFPDRYHSTGVI